MTIARGGRLPNGLDAAMERLNTSVDVDGELWREATRVPASSRRLTLTPSSKGSVASVRKSNAVSSSSGAIAKTCT